MSPGSRRAYPLGHIKTIGPLQPYSILHKNKLSGGAYQF